MEYTQACPSGYSKIFVKYDSSCKYSHELLFKPDETRKENSLKPAGRTLLVANVPPYCSKTNLERIFSKFGKVDSVHLVHALGGESEYHAKPPVVTDLTDNDRKYFPKKEEYGCPFAFIVYQDKSSITKAMGQTIKVAPTLLSRNEAIGMKKWAQEYYSQFPNQDELKTNIDAYMARYDRAILQREEQEKLAGEEDNDGWTKVTKGGKTPFIARTEANQLKAKEKRRNRSRDLLNSYSYQIRESKRQKIAELREKFQEDKQRVQEMIEARKFKPF